MSLADTERIVARIESVLKDYYTPALIGAMVERALAVVMVDVQEYVRRELPAVVRDAVEGAWLEEIGHQVTITVHAQRSEA